MPWLRSFLHNYILIHIYYSNPSYFYSYINVFTPVKSFVRVEQKFEMICNASGVFQYVKVSIMKYV